MKKKFVYKSKDDDVIDTLMNDWMDTWLNEYTIEH